MTLRQLVTFANVARLGSVKAAARELGVSEPAVSAAVGALRTEIGDELYVRQGHALVLTAQGERLASLAGEIGGLADRVTTTVDDEPVDRLLHIAVTGCVEEHVVGPLLAAFAERTPGVHANVEVARAADFADLLDRRRAVIAPPAHRLAGQGVVEPAELADDRWLVGVEGTDPASATGQYLARARIEPA